jgi:hypothetical protein
MMEVRKGRGDPTFINTLVNGEVAPIAALSQIKHRTRGQPAWLSGG